MTSKARALARAAREAEAERLRREAERRARRRAVLTAPYRAVRALMPGSSAATGGGARGRGRGATATRGGLFRRGRTGRVRTRRDRAEVAAIVMGLLVAVLFVFLLIDSWAVRIGATFLALLLAPVLLALTRTDYSRSVHRS